MNVLGVGGWELLVVLLVMMVVAGPKRMILWSGVLGRHVAKFRRMWSETVDVVQQEFDEAGVGIQIPKQVPTRASLNQQAGKALGGVTAPVQEALDEVNTGLGDIKVTTRDAAQSANSVARGSNGGQAVLRTGPATKPATGAATAAKPVDVKAAAAAGAVKSTTWRKSAERAADDYGAWSSHGRARIGAWARDRSVAQPEDEA